MSIFMWITAFNFFAVKQFELHCMKGAIQIKFIIIIITLNFMVIVVTGKLFNVISFKVSRLTVAYFRLPRDTGLGSCPLNVSHIPEKLPNHR